MSDLQYDITGALNSSTYTPQTDAETAAIYNLVSTSEISDETYQYYADVINNLPTANPYNAAIQNPNKSLICDSQDATGAIIGTNTGYNSSGSLNIDPATSGSLGLQYHHVTLAGTAVPDASGNIGINPNNTTTTDGDITQPDQNGVYPGETGYQPTQNQIDIKTNWDNSYASTVSSMSNISSGVNDFESHTDKLIANLPMIIGMVQSALGIANMLGSLANPCLGISTHIGSIMKEGKILMQKIRDKINKVKALIGSAIKTIQKAIADAEAFVNKAINMIEDEVKSLIKSLIHSIHFGLSGLLKSLKLDPCMKSLLHMVGTGSLTSLI